MMRAFFFDKMLNMCFVNNRGNIALTRLSYMLGTSCDYYSGRFCIQSEKDDYKLS